MNDSLGGAAHEPLAHVIGLPVVDSAGLALGVVVGRIISGNTIDVLVRRRRLFHRSRYMRLNGAAIAVGGRTLVYRPELVQPIAVVTRSTRDSHRRGDAA